jgi:spermidine synthase
MKRAAQSPPPNPQSPLAAQSRVTPQAPRGFPLLLLLFAASGCAALIYEVVWYQLLELAIGSTAISLGVLLATFMGGLCLGSLFMPRLLAARRHHALRVFAAVEAGIGACGLLVLFGLPLVNRLYVAASVHGLPAMLLRALLAAVCLLPPTFLMGASLPVIARWVEVTPRGVARIGFLYGANTAGAVLGCFLAGFYLLRVFDMSIATYVAAALNFTVALVSFALAKRSPESAPAADTAASQTPAAAAKMTPLVVVSRNWMVYTVIALSGASALGAEVVWTRLLGLTFGGTVYTFSIILAVFLIGLAIGSGAASWLVRRVPPRIALGIAQLLLAAGIAYTAYMISTWLPYWPAGRKLSTDIWHLFRTDVLLALAVILPATILWGASFPFALAGAASRDAEPGRLVGRVYAANTAGAIYGALIFSVLLIPWIGTQQSERVLVLLAAASSLVILAPAVWKSRSLYGGLALVVSLAGVGYLAYTVDKVPDGVIAYGRTFLTGKDSTKVLFTGEGMNSSIAISQYEDGAIQFHVSGRVEASNEPYDMRMERLLGLMPAAFHPKPRSVLVVGFGAGVTAGAFTVDPDVEHILICEIEPLIPRTTSKWFPGENHDVYHNPRTTIVYDDARHFVLTTPDKYDIITSDPIHPWVKGSATLYTKEYFEMVKAHLNPGGIVTQWVPLYETDSETVKSEVATFLDVFPYGTVWANDIGGEGYDLYMVGWADPLRIDVDAIQQRLRRPDFARFDYALSEINISSAYDLLASFISDKEGMTPWLQGAAINRDRNLRLQYLAGLAFATNRQTGIYYEMMHFRRWPRDLFTGSPETLQMLRRALNLPGAP